MKILCKTNYEHKPAKLNNHSKSININGLFLKHSFSKPKNRIVSIGKKQIIN